MKNNGIRSIAAIGIGTALFYAISYINVPVDCIPNISFQPRIAFLAFASAVFGPLVGAAIGLLGHTLADMFIGGSIWWSWIIPEGIIGVMIGVSASKFKIKEGGFSAKNVVLFNIIQIIANALAWILAAPLLDIAIYAAPSNMAFSQGAIAFVADIITVGIIGTLLALVYSAVKSKISGPASH